MPLSRAPGLSASPIPGVLGPQRGLTQRAGDPEKLQAPGCHRRSPPHGEWDVPLATFSIPGLPALPPLLLLGRTGKKLRWSLLLTPSCHSRACARQAGRCLLLHLQGPGAWRQPSLHHNCLTAGRGVKKPRGPVTTASGPKGRLALTCFSSVFPPQPRHRILLLGQLPEG